MITVDLTTFVISVPQSDLTLITGTLYELDTNDFRLNELKVFEASEDGIVFSDTNLHNTEVTVAGTTFARTLEILSPYSIEFEDLQYSVRLAGSNNNIFDIENGILQQNQVQVIPTNSAGLVASSGGGGGGPSVWSEAEKDEALELGRKASSNAEQANLKMP